MGYGDEMKSIMVIGANGFIGNTLIKRILRNKNWNVIGIDIEQDRLYPQLLNHPKFHFYLYDISQKGVLIERGNSSITIYYLYNVIVNYFMIVPLQSSIQYNKFQPLIHNTKIYYFFGGWDGMG